MIWRCRDRTFDFADGRTLVMGILNVTPDSFSDGGRFVDADAATAHARAMIEAGADIIDVGGESSRPGAAPVSLHAELERVIPIVKRLAPDAVVSVDTTKAEVARQAITAGASIVNDISAGRSEPGILSLAAQTGAGLVLMHMQGTPQTMQLNPSYDDVTREVAAFLRERLAAAQTAGVAAEQIAVDPGIGFGKTVEHNLELLARLEELRPLGRPVLTGTSRKGFIGKLLGRDVAGRLAGSLATCIWGALNGAQIVRVHDVAETAEALRVVGEIRARSRRAR